MTPPAMIPASTMQEEFLAVSIENFEDLKKIGEKTFAQIDEEQMHWSPDAESNSIAINIQHLHGNMRSRWTDIFTTDLEKPDRERDGEFEVRKLSKAELLALWEEGWGYVLSTMRALTPDDLMREVTIRGVPHTVIKAINRQISHYAYHVGQIVYIAKHLRSAEWQTLSIARGQSKAYVPGPSGK
jgi:hypothetical protein